MKSIGRKSEFGPMQGRILVLLLLYAAVLGGCGNERRTSQGLRDIQFQTGITYSEVQGEELKLDLAIPSLGRGPFPAILFIHKGAWDRGGVRDEHRDDMLEAAKRGFVGVAADYRYPEVPGKGGTMVIGPGFPEQLQDLRAAVRWLRANAEEYRIDSDRLGAYGFGSGGDLALLLGLLRDGEMFEQEGHGQQYSAEVQAVVQANAGMDLLAAAQMCREGSELVSIRYIEFAARHLGATKENLDELLRVASPITYVSEDDPPTLSLQGKYDLWSPLVIAEEFDSRMRQAGVLHTLIFRPDVGSIEEELWNREEEFPVWSFFRTYLSEKGDALVASP